MNVFLIIVLLILVFFIATIIFALINGQDLKSFEFSVTNIFAIRAVLDRKKVDDARNNTDFKEKEQKK